MRAIKSSKGVTIMEPTVSGPGAAGYTHAHSQLGVVVVVVVGGAGGAPTLPFYVEQGCRNGRQQGQNHR